MPRQNANKSKFVVILPAIVALLVLPHPALSNQCRSGESWITEFGNRIIHQVIRLGEDRQAASLQVHEGEFSYARLRLALTKPAGTKWRLILRDGWSRPLQIISEASFGDQSNIWTNRFRRTDQIIFDLSVQDGRIPEVVMDQYVLMPSSSKNIAFYSKMTHPWKDLHEANRDWTRQAASVGMMVGGLGTKSWCCTGAVISNEPRIIFMTNFHCGSPNAADSDEARWSKSVCDSTTVDFSWDGDDVPIEFACSRVLAKDPALDLAVIELKPMGTNASPPALRIKKVFSGDVVSIIHHPECGTKKISEICAIGEPRIDGWRGAPGVDFTHSCDTERGSSGGPAMDQQGNLIGMHHLGFREKMKPNGERYCYESNSGIRVDALIPVLQGIPGIGEALRFEE